MILIMLAAIVLALIVLAVIIMIAGYFYINHLKLPKARQGAIRVVCVGDSITQGMGVLFNHPEQNSYPAFLQELLGNQYQVFNCGYTARTLLKSGDHPYTASAHFRASQEIRPDLVLIMLGTNDSKPYNWNAMEYERQLAEFVDGYKSLPGSPQVFLLTPCAAFILKDKTKVVFDIRETVIENEIFPIIQRDAAEKNIPVINVFSATRGHPEYFGDGVHPNVTGDKAIAETIYRAFLENGAAVNGSPREKKSNEDLVK